jgi:hypothetical protein
MLQLQRSRKTESISSEYVLVKKIPTTVRNNKITAVFLFISGFTGWVVSVDCDVGSLDILMFVFISDTGKKDLLICSARIYHWIPLQPVIAPMFLTQGFHLKPSITLVITQKG